ncbi:MAG: AMP-binding protein [Leptolyngbyaceae cyanobacterium MO_188.B28]|nr:AMP-binding protein [Leptolyngbyaceae cyanobacterium MO_188.B28]
MFPSAKIYTAPQNTGKMTLGRTLPSLLTEACDRYPNALALNDWTSKGWRSLSNQAFRTHAEELALGLLNLELQPGDRVGLFMHSDVNFCIADMGCLIARLINVPIFINETPANLIFILKHSEAKALIVSDLELLYQIAPYLWEVPSLKTVIVAKESSAKQISDVEEEPADQECFPASDLDTRLSRAIQLVSMEAVQRKGRAQISEDRLSRLYAAITPNDLATIIYIAGMIEQPQGGDSEYWPIFNANNTIQAQLRGQQNAVNAGDRPKGVMLTHENISADILASFTGMPDIIPGEPITVLSFLPLTHIFARAFLYGHLNYGHSLYFTTPNRVVKHLRDVKPVLFITVPRLLEKIHQKILEKGSQQSSVALQQSVNRTVRKEKHRASERQALRLSSSRSKLFGDARRSVRQTVKQIIYDWALNLANQYELSQNPTGFYARQLKLADKLVFSHWRAAFGGQLKYLICGGAALNESIVNFFAAAGMTIFQGYGLTESSSVASCNRGDVNQAGTVGAPIAGVEMAIAEDGEILIRSPYVMHGYYKNPEATRQALDPAGWLHTGDIGEFTADGLLKITGCKKSIFKLSTGKYVTPQLLERHLRRSPLIKGAIAVGANRKFCAMLIFPNLNQLQAQANAMGLNSPPETLLTQPKIIALYQTLVDNANKQLPSWSTAKRFQLIIPTADLEQQLLNSTLAERRAKARKLFAAEIDALYVETPRHRAMTSVTPLPVTQHPLPTEAQGA